MQIIIVPLYNIEITIIYGIIDIILSIYLIFLITQSIIHGTLLLNIKLFELFEISIINIKQTINLILKIHIKYHN